MKQERVLLINNAAFSFWTHRSQLAEEIQRQGYEVHVAFPEAVSPEVREQSPLHFHQIELKRKSINPLQELKTLLNIIKLIREVKPDLLHLTAIKAVLFGSIAARFCRVPALVCSVTGLGYLYITRQPVIRIIRNLLRPVYAFGFKHPNKRVTFQNRYDQAMFIRKNGLKAKDTQLIMGSGVDLKYFEPLPLPTGATTFILASRLLLDKGVVEFVEAARAVKAQYPDTRFVLVGDIDSGNPATVPQTLLDRWCAEKTIEWWGHKKDMREVFAQAHVVCLPSYREGMPKVLAEAAACQRALIATDTAGCSEIVLHGKNGLLANVQDHDSLEKQFMLLLENPSLIEQMAIRSREIVKQGFSLDSIIKDTLAIYDRLLHNNESSELEEDAEKVISPS